MTINTKMRCRLLKYACKLYLPVKIATWLGANLMLANQWYKWCTGNFPCWPATVAAAAAATI